MTDQATFTLPTDLIKPAVEAHIKKAIVEALDGGSSLVDAFIRDILYQKVDSEGKAQGYRCETPWIDFQVRKALRDAVAKGIQEAMETRATEIKKHIEAQFRKPNSQLLKTIVEGMATGLADMSTNYRMNVEFSHK